MTIGFIGQGYIGKNYADDFEARGHSVIRYALEDAYVGNKDKIKECPIVFIAVPTPTTKDGFDSHNLEEGLGLVAPGTAVVIKSTMVPGTSERLQKQFPDLILMHSPEFLSKATAAYDAAHPFANIIGVAVDDEAHRKAAEEVINLLPNAPFSRIMTSTEAEIVKYTHNVNGYIQIVFSNLVYDLATKVGATWEPIQAAIEADPYISNRYSQPIHKSGRGAGGGCFIKDFAAFRDFFEKTMHDEKGIAALRAFEAKNLELLQSTNKDQEIVKSIYGK